MSEPSERDREYAPLTPEEQDRVLSEVERSYWAGALDLPKVDDPSEYPTSPEGILMPGQRLTYTHRGRRHCGWCGRPVITCEQDLCPAMQKR